LAYRVKLEDRRLEPVEDDDVFDSYTEAMAAFHQCVADPGQNTGSVYVTGDDGIDERVIAAHSFM
jgi:hypothetical protein